MTVELLSVTKCQYDELMMDDIFIVVDYIAVAIVDTSMKKLVIE